MHLQWLGGRLDQSNSSLLVEACEQLSLPAYLYTTPLRKIQPDIEFRDFSLNSSIEDKDEDYGVC